MAKIKNINSKKFVAPKDRSGLRLFNLFVNKYFNIIVLAVVLLVFIFGFSFVLKPKYSKISGVIEESKRIKTERKESLQKNINTLTRYNKSYEEISSENLNKINTILPEKYASEKLFTDLEHFFVRKGYSLNSINIKDDAKLTDASATRSRRTETKLPVEQAIENNSAEVGSMTISLSFQGVNYKSLKNLLALIENNLRLMDVEKISFSHESETLDLDVKTYYLNN